MFGSFHPCILLAIIYISASGYAHKLSKSFGNNAVRFERRLDIGADFSSQSHNKGQETCGYENCDLGKPDMLNVHLVPHTHDDVGWLKTVDEYYYNSVQYILDTVESELQQDSKKRFIYVEMAFFYRWWNEIDDEKKDQVRSLVNQGRLEFILGGWCMNDEASTHYSSIIDQHTLGFDFLKQNFGECGIPKIGWQIDPFGHSREQASIFAQFGFDGLFFARLDYQDYVKRKYSKTLESVWLGSDSLDDRSTLFTGALFDTSYSPPEGYCYECDGVQPIRDRPDLEDYDADEIVKKFFKDAQIQAKYLSTNHIMWTMGSDFHYKNARLNFKNIDKLIKDVNRQQANGSKVNALYSTPSCYLYSLNKANQTYTSKSDDFFPYAHRPHTFWTGYFTSRAGLKGNERTSNNFLQVCKQLDVFGLVASKQSGYDKVDVLKRALGIVQHHDGVSGTSQQHVADDYSKILANGVEKCQDVVKASLEKLLIKYDTMADIQFCNLLNVSYCPASENKDNLTIIVYNPLGQKLSTFARIPVTSNKFQIIDSSLKPVMTQIVPISNETKALPDRYNSSSNYELVFPVNLPALGYSTYFVLKSKDQANNQKSRSSIVNTRDTKDSVVENEYLRLTFNTDTGFLKSIKNLESNIEINAMQKLLYYRSATGNNQVPELQASGAYVFRPDGNVRTITDKPQLTIIKGPVVTEIHQTFADWATQVTRLYRGARQFEIEWTVGPVDLGVEMISSFETSINNKDVFYTDANGRQMLKRVRDYRPSWDLQQSEPVAGNYYPVNSRIFIRDAEKNMQLTVLTDRSEGGASIRNGQLELMLHRRTIDDDALGVAENLNEMGINNKPLVVRGKHYVIFDKVDSSASLHRSMAQYLYMSPYYGFTKLEQSPASFVEKYNVEWTGLKSVLPENIHLLTLEEWHDGDVLLRLEHYYEKDEDPELSKPATVSLKGLFTPMNIKSVEEYTLGANKRLDKAKRLQWNVQGHGQTPRDMDTFVTPVDQKNLNVELKPMQIRTFIVKLE